MQQEDKDNPDELVRLIESLTQGEGDLVTIHNSNPDFDGPNEVIYVGKDFEEPLVYSGSSVLDCLRQAAAQQQEDKEASLDPGRTDTCE